MKSNETQSAVGSMPLLGDSAPWAYELWEHMSHEHGLTLLETEIHDIMLKCDRVRAREYTERAKAASERICCHLGHGMKEDPHVTRLVLSAVGMEFANIPRTV
jgi:hypothetical protein